MARHGLDRLARLELSPRAVEGPPRHDRRPIGQPQAAVGVEAQAGGEAIRLVVEQADLPAEAVEDQQVRRHHRHARVPGSREEPHLGGLPDLDGGQQAVGVLEDPAASHEPQHLGVAGHGLGRQRQPVLQRRWAQVGAVPHLQRIVEQQQRGLGVERKGARLLRGRQGGDGSRRLVVQGNAVLCRGDNDRRAVHDRRSFCFRMQEVHQRHQLTGDRQRSRYCLGRDLEGCRRVVWTRIRWARSVRTRVGCRRTGQGLETEE